MTLINFKNLYKKIYIFWNLYIKYRIYFKKETYSAGKEDLIIKKFFKNKKNGFFVDVGCHHPSRINNTFLLYHLGWRGVNIDMNKLSIDLFNVCRKEDTNLNYAVSGKNNIINFYTNKEHSLTSSILKKSNFEKFKYKKTIESKTLTSILKKTKYRNKQIDFLNIDAEGVDFQVLKSLDFNIYKPKLICIEMWRTNPKKSTKDNNIYKFLKNKNYKLIATEGANCLFAKK
jgi:FkbM family methyltransferase